MPQTERSGEATTSASPLRVAVIVGSNREGRIGGLIANWFVTHVVDRADMELDLLDLATVDLPAIYPRHPSPEVIAYRERIDKADAFVVVTPEYNHGYPAALKQAIDLAGAEWNAKAVGFVSYGGISGGLRAVEQLRQVFPELQAMTVRETVSFQWVHRQFDAAGLPVEPATCGTAAQVMLDQLAWWGRLLRLGRTTPLLLEDDFAIS